MEEVKEQALGNCASTSAAEENNFILRLGKCEVCNAQDAKYTCPKCEVKTCCLSCLNIHKKELNCDGIRDRTKFIQLRNMNKMDYMSDYYFLEECTRFVENRKTDKLKRFTHFNKLLPARLFKLRNAASARKITLKFLLDNFTRRKENSTYFDFKADAIFWRVEWIFPNAGNLKFVDEKCSEKLKLSDLLEKYLNPECKEEVPSKKSLEFYQAEGITNLKLLLKAESIKKCANRFYSLDCTKTLKENLAGKVLVEFPSIYVTYARDMPDVFDVLDSDEDVDTETKDHCDTVEKIRKRQLEKTLSSKAEEEAKNDDLEKLDALLKEKEREERHAKRQKFENEPRNYLFAGEELDGVLSSDGNETEEEK